MQLLYSGEASDFAWILPLPSVPELAVSHNDIFTRLQWATQPFFQLNFQEDDCGFPMVFRDDCPGCESIPTSADEGVEVVIQEQVGPYDTAVITSEDPQAIVDWLVDNGYQLGALGVPLLTPYVEDDFYFLALKLAADQEVGDLQPIAMTYAAERPGIPIRLTAVATVPDLGVRAWVLADHRAIPENYLHVKINEALIDWWSGGFNYPDVVTQAADEAGGQAFVTDYAGPSSIVGDFFFGEFDLETLRGKSHPADFLDAALGQGFPRDTQMQTLIRRHIPMPAAVLEEGVLEVVFDGDREAYDKAKEEGWLQDAAERSFYNDMRAYDRWTADLDFDAAAFTADLERIVVEPLEGLQQLFEEKAYLTRLYTTLSADEMTVDPMFDYNPDLPTVDNIRSADARWDCAGSADTPLEKWELVVTLADGREVRSKPFADGGGPVPFAEPAALTVEQLRTSGPPEIIRTSVETVNAPRLRALGLDPSAELPQPLQREHDPALPGAPLRPGGPTRLQPAGAEGPHPDRRLGPGGPWRGRLGRPRPGRTPGRRRRLPLPAGDRDREGDAEAALPALTCGEGPRIQGSALHRIAAHGRSLRRS